MMPMRRELYPESWPQISLAIRERSGWRCEWEGCGAAQGQPHPITGSIVVLPVMHLNHDTTDNRPENLRSACQRCHLRYDAQEHAKHARETRARKRQEAALASGQQMMWGGE